MGIFKRDLYIFQTMRTRAELPRQHHNTTENKRIKRTRKKSPKFKKKNTHEFTIFTYFTMQRVQD